MARPGPFKKQDNPVPMNPCPDCCFGTNVGYFTCNWLDSTLYNHCENGAVPTYDCINNQGWGGSPHISSYNCVCPWDCVDCDDGYGGHHYINPNISISKERVIPPKSKRKGGKLPNMAKQRNLGNKRFKTNPGGGGSIGDPCPNCCTSGAGTYTCDYYNGTTFNNCAGGATYPNSYNGCIYGGGYTGSEQFVTYSCECTHHCTGCGTGGHDWENDPSVHIGSERIIPPQQKKMGGKLPNKLREPQAPCCCDSEFNTKRFGCQPIQGGGHQAYTYCDGGGMPGSTWNWNPPQPAGYYSWNGTPWPTCVEEWSKPCCCNPGCGGEECPYGQGGDGCDDDPDPPVNPNMTKPRDIPAQSKRKGGTVRRGKVMQHGGPAGKARKAWRRGGNVNCPDGVTDTDEFGNNIC